MIPQSVEAEQHVIGGCLVDNAAYQRVADLITDADFFRDDHAVMWRAIKGESDAGRPFDYFTLPERYTDVPCAYLVDLARNIPSAANIDGYAQIVADRAKRRRLMEAGQRLVQSACGETPTDDVLAEAQRDMIRIASAGRHDLKTINDGLIAMVNAMQRRFEDGGQAGTSYGLPALDFMTGGKKPGELIILAARPSMGKTLLALQGALQSPRPLIFSFETTEEALTARMTAHVGHFPLNWITRPTDAPDDAMPRILAASKLVRERMKGLIYDGRRLTHEQMRAIALREHAKSPLTEIITDHLGLVKLPGRGRLDQEMSEVTKAHKDMAREMGIPAVLLMQLNRGVETRADKRPFLSDLRECGAAEEDADVVAMLYRDEYYDREGSPHKGFVEIFLRKNRDGEPGECWAHAHMAEMRFEQAEPQSRSAGQAAGHGGQRGAAPGIRPRSQSRPFSVVG